MNKVDGVQSAAAKKEQCHHPWVTTPEHQFLKKSCEDKIHLFCSTLRNNFLFLVLLSKPTFIAMIDCYDVTLADADTNSILTDKFNGTIQGNVKCKVV